MADNSCTPHVQQGIRNALKFIGMVALLATGTSNANAQSVADFALGGSNICAIDTNGALECTTRFDASTFLPPNDGTLYQQVVSGLSLIHI